jgi:hypothetical protein
MCGVYVLLINSNWAFKHACSCRLGIELSEAPVCHQLGAGQIVLGLALSPSLSASEQVPSVVAGKVANLFFTKFRSCSLSFLPSLVFAQRQIYLQTSLLVPLASLRVIPVIPFGNAVTK